MFFQMAWRHFRQHKLLGSLFILSIIIEVAYAVAAPLSLKYLVDEAFTPKDLQVFLLILFLLLCGGILSICASAGGDYALAKLSGGMIQTLRTQLIDHLQKQSFSFFERFRVGDLVTRFSTDMSSMEQVVRITSPFFMREVLSILLGLVVLFYMEWKLTLAMMFGSILLVVGPKLLQARAETDNQQFKEAQEHFSNTIDEMVKGYKTIKGLHQQPRFRERAREQIRSLFTFGLRLHLTNSWLERLPLTVLLILNGVMIGFGGYLIFQDQMSVGDFIAFFTLFMTVGQSGSNISMLMPSLIDSRISFRRVGEILNQVTAIPEREHPVVLPSPVNIIEMEHVTFGYNENKDQLQDVSLHVNAGSFVAFVGASGSGKSTALQLLGRFYDPKQGAVMVDGHDLREIDEASLRKAVVMVMQDTFLFNCSLRENLLLDRIDVSDEEMIKAAKLARIHDVITSWPDNYDTPVYHEGGSLSGGERQRIAIARALLRQPQILLLDEITAALDPATEADINAMVSQLRGRQTIVSVTHRLASVMQADVIHVFKQGRIVESGTHQELLQKRGAYHELWKKQHGFQLSHDGLHAAVDGSRLANLPFFEGIQAPLLSDIAALFTTEHCKEGESIVTEGEEGNKFYIIVRGSFEVLKNSEKEMNQHIATLQDGDYFGEIALLKNIPRTATVRAEVPSILLSIRRAAFHSLTAQHPQLLVGLERTLQERL